jgi:hypothetical protein
MRLALTLTAVLAYTSFVSAGCYSDGESWGSGTNIDQAKYWVGQVCRGNLGGRDFNAREKRSACYNIGDNKRVNFEMTYKENDPKRHMSANDCIRHLTGFINGCARGGKHDDGRWAYR